MLPPKAAPQGSTSSTPLTCARPGTFFFLVLFFFPPPSRGLSVSFERETLGGEGGEGGGEVGVRRLARCLAFLEDGMELRIDAKGLGKNDGFRVPIYKGEERVWGGVVQDGLFLRRRRAQPILNPPKSRNSILATYYGIHGKPRKFAKRTFPRSPSLPFVGVEGPKTTPKKDQMSSVENFADFYHGPK